MKRLTSLAGGRRNDHGASETGELSFRGTDLGFTRDRHFCAQVGHSRLGCEASSPESIITACDYGCRINQSNCTPNTDTPPSVTKIPIKRTRSLGARFQTIAPTSAIAKPIYFKGVLPSMFGSPTSSLMAYTYKFRADLL